MSINKLILFYFSIIAVGCVASNPVDVVSTQGRQVMVNGTPYFMEGVCYHPVPKNTTKRSFENIDQDLALMKEAGINTLRVYEPIDQIEILDKIENAEMKVVIGFGYNQNGYYDILSGSFIDYIQKYKNHNAILLWELGNEYNYHPQWFEGD